MSTREDVFDYLPVPDSRMAGRIARQVAGVGAMCGAIDAIGVLRTAHLHTTGIERVELLLVTIATATAGGALAGFATGLWAQHCMEGQERWSRYRTGFVAGAMLCVLGTVAEPVARVAARGEWVKTIGMLATMAFVVGTAWANAGYWFRRELLGAAPRFPWWGIAALGAAAFSVPTLLSDGVPANDAQAPKRAVNLVLVTIDTLRRDHVGAYGGAALTPTLDGLAREGLLVEDAVTPFPETAPSHASMFTGLSPYAHGVQGNGQTLHPGHVTLADQLVAAGWRTGAFVGSHALSGSTGMSQGFGVYDDAFAPHGRLALRARLPSLLVRAFARYGRPADVPWLLERAGSATVARALTWTDAQPADAPVFLWVHLFEPHAPYEAPGFDPRVDHRAILAEEPGHAYTDAERTALRARYAQEVREADRQVGVLLDGLRARGRLEDAMVLVVADHGEGLGEHGVEFTHHGLGEEVLRVPMIVWAPNGAWTHGSRLPGQVSVELVANTLLTFANVPALTPRLDVASRAVGEADDPAPVVLGGHDGRGRRAGPLLGVRGTGMKLVRSAQGDVLYDLSVDPGETRDIAAEQPEVLAHARSILADLPATGDGPREVDGMLRALGYRE